MGRCSSCFALPCFSLALYLWGWFHSLQRYIRLRILHTHTISCCCKLALSPLSLTPLVSQTSNQEFLKLYDHPKVSQLEAVLLKRITEDEARHILFFPDQNQAAYYQTLIANPPKGAPAEHPQRAVQVRSYRIFICFT